MNFDDLVYKIIKEINELYYDSLVDTNWRKAHKDYQRAAVTFARLGTALEEIVHIGKILSGERKPGTK